MGLSRKRELVQGDFKSFRKVDQASVHGPGVHAERDIKKHCREEDKNAT
jgi:hypothetical protein